MENCDYLVIGGGIVGLATALELQKQFPQGRLILLEKEASLASHQSGHNSGVIHSGIYYRPGSLKSLTCQKGIHLLEKFCQENHIHWSRTGKVIVATKKSEIPALESLFERGKQNQVPGMRLLNAQEISEIEPFVQGVKGIWVPHAGIVDYRKVSQKMAEITASLGGELLVNAPVVDIRPKGQRVLVKTADNEVFSCRYLFNCAGLYADKIAQLAGIRPQLAIIPFRGEYYQLRPDRKFLVKGLVYPIPDIRFPFLGVHLTRTIDNIVEAGPNAVLAFKREGYRNSDFSLAESWEMISQPGFWRLAQQHWRFGLQELQKSWYKQAFTRSVQKLIPEIKSSDLMPYRSGVRAQAIEPSGKIVDDFCLVATSRMLHVLNTPSPAATASLAIAERIVKQFKARL